MAGKAIAQEGPTPPASPLHTAKAARRRNYADWLRDFPARSAFWVTRLGPVSRMLASRYRRAVASHRRMVPTLSPGDRAIVEALDRDGIYISSLDCLGLPDSRETVRIGQMLSAEFSAEAHRQAAAGVEFNMVPPERIVVNPRVFAWGLSDRLLDIAEAYLGMPAAYDGMQIIYTVADGREVSTRRWHRDWEDRKMLKIAIYLNDVDTDGGPFEAVRGPRRTDEDGFAYDLMSDDDLRRTFGEEFAERVTSCTGRAGTVLFVDTARQYHRGRPATGADRTAIFYSYFARRPRHPFFCERSGLSRQQIERLARHLPPRQRAAALWRRGLPGWLRMIPSARV